jgi:hypothetical protein
MASTDFNFLLGSWSVHHRRLRERLTGSQEWVEFEGTVVAQSLMGGNANVDNNILHLPGEAYRAVSLRSFDPKTKEWLIWWLDGRNPGALEKPVRGSFEDQIGVFYADDAFDGRRIRVRFTWSQITPNSCRWEQAFSPDGGALWETNWIMDFSRERV